MSKLNGLYWNSVHSFLSRPSCPIRKCLKNSVGFVMLTIKVLFFYQALHQNDFTDYTMKLGTLLPFGPCMLIKKQFLNFHSGLWSWPLTLFYQVWHYFISNHCTSCIGNCYISLPLVQGFTKKGFGKVQSSSWSSLHLLDYNETWYI